MVLFVSVGVAIALANLLNRIAPLILLSGADYLDAALLRRGAGDLLAYHQRS